MIGRHYRYTTLEMRPGKHTPEAGAARRIAGTNPAIALLGGML